MYPVIEKIQTGTKIKQLMELKGYTVRDIQEYLNLACVQSIYHWLDGRSDTSKARKIGFVFG